MTGEGYSVAIKNNNNNNNKTLYSIHQKASISVTVFPREVLNVIPLSIFQKITRLIVFFKNKETENAKNN